MSMSRFLDRAVRGMPNHAGGNCSEVVGIDQDETARPAIAIIRVKEQLPCGSNLHPSNFVEGQRFRRGAVEAVHVQLIQHTVDKCLRSLRGVLQDIGRGCGQAFAVVHPGQRGLDVVVNLRDVMTPDDHVSATDVDLVFQRENHRVALHRFLHFIRVDRN